MGEKMTELETYYFYNYVMVEKRDLVKVLHAARRFLEKHPEEFNDRDRSWVNASIGRCEECLDEHQKYVSEAVCHAFREAYERGKEKPRDGLEETK